MRRNTCRSAAGPVTWHSMPADRQSSRTVVLLPGRAFNTMRTFGRTAGIIFVTCDIIPPMPTFTKILKLCQSLGDDLPDVVFIGGVAVYLHVVQWSQDTIPLESSHDADFMISFSDYGILKDAEEVTATPRLAKHQMVVDGVEFDVYVERLNRLVVPYDEVYAHSTTVEGIRVACLEHLLILKLEALEKRGHSGKGAKDRRDVAKIGLMLGRSPKKYLLSPYLRDAHAALLDEVAKSTIFYELCSRNAHAAKKMRSAFESFARSITR